MKNKLILLAILFIPFLISCGDDDNPTKNGFSFNNTYYDMDQLAQFKKGDGKNSMIYFKNGTYDVNGNKFVGSDQNRIGFVFKFESGDELPLGTYTFDDSGDVNGTFVGHIRLGYDSSTGRSTLTAAFDGGTVEVGQVNGNYVLDFDVQTSSGNIQGELNQEVDYVVTE